MLPVAAVEAQFDAAVSHFEVRAADLDPPVVAFLARWEGLEDAV